MKRVSLTKDGQTFSRMMSPIRYDMAFPPPMSLIDTLDADAEQSEVSDDEILPLSLISFSRDLSTTYMKYVYEITHLVSSIQCAQKATEVQSENFFEKRETLSPVENVKNKNGNVYLKIKCCINERGCYGKYAHRKIALGSFKINWYRQSMRGLSMHFGSICWKQSALVYAIKDGAIKKMYVLNANVFSNKLNNNIFFKKYPLIKKFTKSVQ